MSADYSPRTLSTQSLVLHLFPFLLFFQPDCFPSRNSLYPVLTVQLLVQLLIIIQKSSLLSPIHGF